MTGVACAGKEFGVKSGEFGLMTGELGTSTLGTSTRGRWWRKMTSRSNMC